MTKPYQSEMEPCDGEEGFDSSAFLDSIPSSTFYEDSSSSNFYNPKASASSVADRVPSVGDTMGQDGGGFFDSEDQFGLQEMKIDLNELFHNHNTQQQPPIQQQHVVHNLQPHDPVMGFSVPSLAAAPIKTDPVNATSPHLPAMRQPPPPYGTHMAVACAGTAAITAVASSSGVSTNENSSSSTLLPAPGPSRCPKGKNPKRKSTAEASSSRVPRGGGRKKAVPKNSDEYVQKRERNNIAVKKSREKAKKKSEETDQLVSDLRSENDGLQARLDRLTQELDVLKSLFTSAASHINLDKVLGNKE